MAVAPTPALTSCPQRFDSSSYAVDRDEAVDWKHLLSQIQTLRLSPSSCSSTPTPATTTDRERPNNGDGGVAKSSNDGDDDSEGEFISPRRDRIDKFPQISRLVSAYVEACRPQPPSSNDEKGSGTVGDVMGPRHQLNDAAGDVDDEEATTRRKNKKTELILNTRQALRYALACLSLDAAAISSSFSDNGDDGASAADDERRRKRQRDLLRLRRGMQRHAIDCRLHLPLCALLSLSGSASDDEGQAVVDGKVRRLASRVLCNLLTHHRHCASVMWADVSLSPTSEEQRARLMHSLVEKEPIDDGSSDVGRRRGEGGTAAASSSDGGRSGRRREGGCNWVDMMTNCARAGDRASLAATVAALHNGLASLEEKENEEEIEKEEETEVDGGDAACPKMGAVESCDGDGSIAPPNRITAEVAAQQIASDGLLVNVLLRHMLPAEALSTKGDDVGGGNDSIADGATEWISLLLERLTSYGLFPRLSRSASGSGIIKGADGSGDSDEGQLRITPEVVVLMHCIAHSIEEYAATGTAPSSSRRRRPHPLGGRRSKDQARSVFDSLLFLANEACSLRRGFHDSEENATASEERFEGESNCIRSVRLSMIEMLGTVLAVGEGSVEENSTRKVDWDSPVSREARLAIGQQTNLLPSVLLELGQLVDALSVRNDGKKARDFHMTTDEQRNMIALIRFIVNATFQCRFNQDLLRTTEVPLLMSQSSSSSPPPTMPTTMTRTGLHVLLSTTSFATACFTLREWSIVALRNALDENEENQSMVARLEAQQAVQTAEVQQLGIKVALDQKGNVQVTKKEDEPPPPQR